MFVADDVTVTFGGVVALDGFSLMVEQQEVVGLVGPNGSGKSTFINAATGLVKSDGRVTFGGQPVALGKPGRIGRFGVRRTFQTPQVLDELTCLENVLIGAADRRLRGLSAAWLRRPAMLRHERSQWGVAAEALEFAGLRDQSDVLAAELSYGQRRKLELARVYMSRPTLLMLDEPAAGLNDAETSDLIGLLTQWREMTDGPALLVVEHKIDFLDQLCHRMVVLDLGKQIAEGKPAEVWRDPRVVDAYLGTGDTDA